MTRLIERARQQSLAWLVFFVIVVDLIGFGIVIPILPFLSPQLGGGTDDIALILATYSVAAAIVALALRAPFLVVILVAAATAAVLRGAGLAP